MRLEIDAKNADDARTPQDAPVDQPITRCPGAPHDHSSHSYAVTTLPIMNMIIYAQSV
jgi:hypothetical protein